MNAVTKIEPKEQPLAVVGESASLLAVIERAASNPEVDVDKMERLMQMHERVLSRQAEQAFNAAMTAAQAEIGRVGADKTNPQTRSDYATYAAIDREVRPVYTQHGFALSFGTEPCAAENYVRVICYVSHRDGYTRAYHVDMPADGKGARGNDVMTKTHAAGSAMSYGQRYLLKLIFNVAIGVDLDDDDGNAASTAPDRPAEKPAAPTASAPYPADAFQQNLPKWQALLESGKKSADEIIAAVETKGTLTDQQKAAIRDCAPVHGGAA